MLTSTNRCMIKIFFLQIFIIFCQRTADSSREEKQKRHLFKKGKEELLKVLMTYVIKNEIARMVSACKEREREREIPKTIPNSWSSIKTQVREDGILQGVFV